MFDFFKDRIYSRFIEINDEQRKAYGKAGIKIYEKDGIYYVDSHTAGEMLTRTINLICDATDILSAQIKSTKSKSDALSSDVQEMSNFAVSFKSKMEGMESLLKTKLELMDKYNREIDLKIRNINNNYNELVNSISKLKNNIEEENNKVINNFSNITATIETNILNKFNSETKPKIIERLNVIVRDCVDKLFKENGLKIGLLIDDVDKRLKEPLQLVDYTKSLVKENKKVDDKTFPVIREKELSIARNKIKELGNNQKYKEKSNDAVKAIDNYLDKPDFIKGQSENREDAIKKLTELRWKIEGISDKDAPAMEKKESSVHIEKQTKSEIKVDDENIDEMIDEMDEDLK